MPRTSLQSRFRSPAKLGDELSVGVGVAEITDRRIGFAFDIHERGTDRLICDASYRVACVDAATFAPRPFRRRSSRLLDAGAARDDRRPPNRSASRRRSTPRRFRRSPRRRRARSEHRHRMRRRASHLRRPAAQRQPRRDRAARRARGAARGTRPAAAARRAGVRLRLLRRDQDRRGAGPVEHAVEAADYEYVVRDSRAGVIIVSPELLPQIERVSAEVRRGGRATSSWLTRIRRRPSGSSAKVPTSSMPSRPAATRRPSGCIPRAAPARRRAASICSTTWSSAPSCSRRACSASVPSDRCFSVAKLFFAYGLGNALYLSVLRRRDVDPVARSADAAARVRRDREAPADAVLLRADQLRHAAGASTPDAAPDFDLSSIRLAVSAGEALPPALYERFKQRFGVDILDGIGSTEAGHMFISNRPGAHPPRIERPDRRRLRRADSRRRRTAGAGRRDWQSLDRGRLGVRRLLEPAREDEEHD